MWTKDEYEWSKDSNPFTTSNCGLFAHYGYCRDLKIYSELFEVSKFFFFNVELNLLSHSIYIYLRCQECERRLRR